MLTVRGPGAGAGSFTDGRGSATVDQWAEVRATAPGDALSVLFAGIGAATSVGMGYGVSAQAPQRPLHMLAAEHQQAGEVGARKQGRQHM